MKKTLPILIISAIVAGMVGFFGGEQYAKKKNGVGNFRNLSAEQRQQMFGQAGAGQRSGNGQSGGFVSGEIIAKDDASITVKLADGGSKIIFFSASTKVSKQTDGTPDDLKVGESVSATGTANADGSVAAQTIQLRPATSSVPVK